MLNLDLDGKYADALELALYNGALSGLSRDGEHYFYQNPLESDGTHTRWEWHPCPCCTMNVSRLVASVGGYFYSAGPNEIAVHLYGGASTTVDVGGNKVGLREESNYPWSGAIRIQVDPEAPADFTLKLRIPGWARHATLKLNGETVDVGANSKDGYVAIRRTWSKGDAVALDLPMPVERIYAHPNVRADIGRVCLKRGPFVYCAEQADNTVPVPRVRLPRNAGVEAVEKGDLFDGVVTLVASGRAARIDDWDDHLYRPDPPLDEPAKWTAIPYFLWNNREPGSMMVWIPEA